jgi:hypothetical protein
MGRLRQYSLRPHDENLSHGTHEFLDWVQTSLNILVGQNLSGAGFSSLNKPVVDPTSTQLKSAGSRTTALATNFGFTCPSTTSISLFWDGTNNSSILRIYRDDNTVAGPFPGNQTITGLLANTQYFFYPYFDESLQRVLFVSVPPAVGSPPIAYTAATIAVAQQQILRGRLQLASDLAVTGITTPAAGNTPATNAGGGGSGGGVYLGRKLTQ